MKEKNEGSQSTIKCIGPCLIMKFCLPFISLLKRWEVCLSLKLWKLVRQYLEKKLWILSKNRRTLTTFNCISACSVNAFYFNFCIVIGDLFFSSSSVYAEMSKEPVETALCVQKFLSNKFITKGYYDEKADEFIAKTLFLDMSILYKEFIPYIPKNGKILDVGCGSGRDALFFKNNGYDVVAIDSSIEMVKRSTNIVGESTLYMKVEDISFKSTFDGIWANASLLHIPNKDLLMVFKKLCNALKSGGVMFFSFKYGDAEVVRSGGRLFNSQNEISIRKILKMIPEFEEIKLWILPDKADPPSIQPFWLNGLVKKRNL